MAATMLIAAVLMVQAPAEAIMVDGNVERIYVGYEELMAGRPDAAIARISLNSASASQDPAVLINLGSAYARLGQIKQARSQYRAAMISTERFDLELADGRWMDSRRAARLAESMLDQGEVIALR